LISGAPESLLCEPTGELALAYQWLLNECEGKKLNPIATESFKDFYLHRNKTFLEGGYNKRADLADWVRMKGFVIP